MKHLKRQAGFSLTEAIIATAVFGFTISASLVAVRVSVEYIDQAFQIADAQIKAQNSMEIVYSQKEQKHSLFNELSFEKGQENLTEADEERSRMKAKLNENFMRMGKGTVKRSSFAVNNHQDAQGDETNLVGVQLDVTRGSGKVSRYTRYFYEP